METAEPLNQKETFPVKYVAKATGYTTTNSVAKGTGYTTQNSVESVAKATGDLTPNSVESVAKATGYTTPNSVASVAKATVDLTPNRVESVAKATGDTTPNSVESVAKGTGYTTPNSVENVAKATADTTPNRVASVAKATGDTTTPNSVESVAEATGCTTTPNSVTSVAEATGDLTPNSVASVADLRLTKCANLFPANPPNGGVGYIKIRFLRQILDLTVIDSSASSYITNINNSQFMQHGRNTAYQYYSLNFVRYKNKCTERFRPIPVFNNTSVVTNAEIAQLKKYLSGKSKIAIVMHKSPDGDAIGSSLGLYHFLKSFKTKATVISPNAYPDFLKWMPDSKQGIDYEKDSRKALSALRSADLIVCLDFNALKRIEKLGNAVAKSKALKLLIDHHPQPEDFADIVFHSTHASSTAELVFDFIGLLGEEKKINRNIANCLYAGIMTDTGSFRFSSTTAHTHKVAAQLMEKGAETTRIHHLIEDSNREIRMRLFGYALLEKMKILHEYRTGYIALTQSELKHFDYKEGDTEGFVNQPLAVKGMVFSAFFAEKEGSEEIRISFRSKNRFDVNLFARKHFDGGGHLNAAGGKSHLSMDETIMKFINLLKEYKNELNPAGKTGGQ